MDEELLEDEESMPESKIYPALGVMNLLEVNPTMRGDDDIIHKPYAGIAIFHDGRYIIASREKAKLTLVGADDLVIASADPLSLRHEYDKTICHGIALHVGEHTLYMLVSDGSTDLYITRIEIVPESPYFIWNPAFDIRLPSMAAMNESLDKFHEVAWNTMPEYREVGSILTPSKATPYEDIAKVWEQQILKHQEADWKPESPEDEFKPHDELAIDADNFPMIGPILQEYKPSMTNMGSRVVVGCTSAQVYQIGFDLKVWIDKTNIYPTDNIRAWWKDFLRGLVVDAGWPIDGDPIEIRRKDGTLAEYYHPDPVVEYYFPEGQDKWWWIEPVEAQVGNNFLGYVGSWLHFKIYFQHPTPVASLVTLHPDLGVVDGIAHVGSGYFCTIPKFAPKDEEGNELPIDYDHVDLMRYYPIGTASSEMDLYYPLARLNFPIHANVMDWVDGDHYDPTRTYGPWPHVGAKNYKPRSRINFAGRDVTSFKKFISWWWNEVYCRFPTQNPIDFIREHSEYDDFPSFLGYLREDFFCPTVHDAAREGFSATPYFKTDELIYPWSYRDKVQSTCIEICSGTIMFVTEDKIFRGDISLHTLISTYNQRVIGSGTDIYVGKVLIDKPKIVTVWFRHTASDLVKLADINIKIIPDLDFPYYRFAKLSLDGVTWADSIQYEHPLVSPNVSENSILKTPYAFKFYVKLECDSTIEDPKPIKVETTYKRLGS